MRNKDGVVAGVIDVERLPPKEEGLVEEVDGMDDKVFEAIVDAVTLVGLGGGVEFDDG
ncbi:hypothetical protein BGX24_004796, partial [Mortierella sp. AD032]